MLASRDTPIMGPGCRSKASKFFNTEKQGEGIENTEKDNMALRAVFDRTLREAPKSFSSVASVPSPCFSGLKNLALLALAVGTWYPHAIRRGLDGYE